MQLKSSYIFIKRKEKEKITSKKTNEENVIYVSVPPSFISILKETYSNINVNKEDMFISNGTFEVKINNKAKTVNFNIYNV